MREINKKGLCMVLVTLLMGLQITHCTLIDMASGNEEESQLTSKKEDSSSSMFSLLLLNSLLSGYSNSGSDTTCNNATSCIYKQYGSSYSSSNLYCLDSANSSYSSIICSYCSMYSSINPIYNTTTCKNLGFTDGMNSSSSFMNNYHCSYNATSSNTSSSTQPCTSTIINNYFGTDKTAPTISSTVPTNNATSISTSKDIIIYFSEELDVNTIALATVTLSKAGVPVSSYSISYDYYGKSIKIPYYISSSYYSIFTAASTYTVTVKTGIKDVAGNALASEYSFSFTTQ